MFEHLDSDEYDVLAAAIPLRGVASDVSYLGAVIDQLDGPVVLVGHSYSGCVITVAGASEKVAGLVYVPDSCPTRASRSATCRRATRRSRWATSSSHDRCSTGMSSCRSMLSKPDLVAGVIREAVQACSADPAA